MFTVLNLAHHVVMDISTIVVLTLTQKLLKVSKTETTSKACSNSRTTTLAVSKTETTKPSSVTNSRDTKSDTTTAN
jgi:guanyl-specific ribonuclease Sa